MNVDPKALVAGLLQRHKNAAIPGQDETANAWLDRQAAACIEQLQRERDEAMSGWASRADDVRELQSALAAATAEQEGLKRNSERYILLRALALNGEFGQLRVAISQENESAFDAVLDQALTKAKGAT